MPSCPACATPLLPEEQVCPTCGAVQRGAGRTRLPLERLVKDGAALVFRNYPLFLILVGPLVLLSSVLSFFMTMPGFLGLPPAEEMAAAAPALVWRGVLLMLALFAGTIFLGFLASGLAIVATERLAQGERPAPGEVWRLMTPRLGRFIGTHLLVMIALIGAIIAPSTLGFLALLGGFGTAVSLSLLFVGLAAGIGLALLIMVRYALAPTASMVDGAGPREAMKGSALLSEGNRLRILGLLVLLVAASIAVSMPFSIAATIVGVMENGGQVPGAPSLAQQAINAVGNLAAGLVVGPLFGAVFYLAYRHLQQPPAAPGAAPPPPPAPGAGGFFQR